MSTKLYDVSDWCRQGKDKLEDYPYLGEIDIELDIGEVVQIEGEYFASCVLNFVNHSVGVRRIELDLGPDPGERGYKDNLVCPYCDYEESDSWELPDSDTEHECGRCGATMSFERVVMVEYDCDPVRPPNIVKAEWVKVEGTTPCKDEKPC